MNGPLLKPPKNVDIFIWLPLPTFVSLCIEYKVPVYAYLRSISLILHKMRKLTKLPVEVRIGKNKKFYFFIITHSTAAFTSNPPK